MTDESKRLIWKLIVYAIMIAIYVFFSILNTRNGGSKAFIAGSKLSWKLTLNMSVDLILMFLLSGQIGQYIMSNYGSELKVWIDGSGGIFKSTAASILSPSSITVLPIIKGLWHEANADRLMLVYFMLISNLLGWQIIFIRAPLVSWSIYFWVILSGIITSSILAMIFMVLIKLRAFLSPVQLWSGLALYFSACAAGMKKAGEKTKKSLL